MPFLVTPRGRHFYRQAAGGRPLLVFLHSNLGSSTWWRPVLNLLPPGWRGVAPDAIGSGYSDQVQSPERCTIASQVLDLASFVDAIGLRDIHLIAHGASTPVAVEFALQYPALAASLVLVGPVPVTGVTTPAEAFPLLERLPAEADLLRRALMASAPALEPDSPLFRSLLADAARISGVALVAGAHSLDGWQPAGPLHRLALPVLLIRGEHDGMVSQEEAEQTLLAIPGANNLEVLAGAGHSPMVERPHAFAEVLVRFLSEDRSGYDAVRGRALS